MREGSFMSNATTVIAQNVGANSFAITTSTGHHMVLSGLPDNEGPRPMEMLLVALAGCSGVGILDILRKMNQQVTNYEIKVDGERAETYPKMYTKIRVTHVFTGKNLQAAKIQRAIELDTENYCGVNVMLGKSAEIEHGFEIIEKE
jgi:putative redox protein